METSVETRRGMNKSAAVEDSQSGCLVKKQYWDDKIHMIAAVELSPLDDNEEAIGGMCRNSL